MQKKILLFAVLLSLLSLLGGIALVGVLFVKGFWIFLLVLCVMLLGYMLLAYYFTQRLFKPLWSLNHLDHLPYPELRTFFERIHKEEVKSQFTRLKKKKQELQSFTQNMRDGLIVLNRSFKILSENKAAEKYFSNLHKIESILSLDNPQFLQRLLEHFRSFKKAKTQDSIKENFTFHLPNPKKELEVVFSPIFSQKNKFRGMMIVLCDVTEIKRLQNLRKEFSANVTHELKTPLTSILASVEMIKNGLVATEDLMGFVDKIYQESKRLLEMIDEILKISFLDEAQSLPLSPVNLKEICLRVCGRLEFLAKQHRVEFVLDLEDVQVLGVYELLETLVFNLCDNAIKYNHQGGVVKLRLKRRDKCVELSIQDSGIGIPKEFQERIFERFFCVDKSRSKKLGGSGLGLSIVKSALKFHHATIALKSHAGGSTFKVCFPLKEHLVSHKEFS